MTTPAKHSSASNEHYTPPEIIEAARKCMGRIELDPASCALANQTVKADRFYTKADRALRLEWKSPAVWLNPPGGKDGNQSRTLQWWEKLVYEWQAERLREAIFLAFNLEFLQTSQRSLVKPMQLPFCVPAKRLDFYKPIAKGTKTKAGGSPTHANVIVMLPSIREHPESIRERFSSAFEKFGTICNGAR
jgi:hypothetical protein